jgi:glycosyltransferase involved in cell wall biosynthesis
MKISCFTFIRNGNLLKYPFVESIKSALPICDEFVVNVGNSEDNTLEMVKAIGDPKIRIIESTWNEKLITKGYVYAQQKCIAQYNCTGDWAFYLECDEIIHENDYDNIVKAMRDNLDDQQIEALAFKYIHFYGNTNTYLDNANICRRETRIIRNTIRSWTSDSLFFLVLDNNNKVGRYPKAKMIDATIYHYGWARPQEALDIKVKYSNKLWNKIPPKSSSYKLVDSRFLKEFKGTHPAA